jgi:ribonuclease P protein component
MIKKEFRLTERETKRVLQKWKPFFSYEIVLNKLRNNYNYNRFAIVLSSKSVNSWVERNFFRRKFYDFCKDKIFVKSGNDLVFVVKQKSKLDKDDENCLEKFKKDLEFLMKKSKELNTYNITK